MLFSGIVDLPWWGCVLAAAAMTHVTIISVTLYLHRSQTHHALELHPAVSHFLRLWLWLTTGMQTKEWVAVHRKHHAKCETPEDPHSPQVHGIHRVLWLGVVLYVKEAARPGTVQRYGRGTPDDWLERNLYARFAAWGVFLTLGLDLVVFGVIPGSLIWLTQMAWIPFLAAGVINGVGHYWGYRNWSTPDASTNIVPWGIVIGGEELHNNHHAYPTSARFSRKRHELDAGWAYIRVLSALGLARARHDPPAARLAPAGTAGVGTLEAVIRCRYEVLASYDRLPSEARPDEAQTLLSMRAGLTALWARSMASREDLAAQLEAWCRRAEASGIAPLAEFSRRLRCYA